MKKYAKTLFFIGLMLFLSAPMVGGSGLGFLWLFGWVIYAPTNLIFSKKTDKTWGKQCVLWQIGFALMFAHHQYYQHNLRQYANQITTELHHFYAQNERYPTMQEWKTQHPTTSYHLHYICLGECEKNQRSPILIYSSAINVFDRYSYDFNQKSWEHKPD
ncbi:hypothetical protein ACKLNO_04410 [Neisseriaceae bacterium B1]